jgi:hypothetical protein
MALVAAVQRAEVSVAEVGEACDTQRNVAWERLPLHTPLVLDDVVLMDCVRIKTDMGFEDFIGVYEEFVATYALTSEHRKQGAAKWLEEHLSLSAPDFQHAFAVSGERRGRYAYTDRHAVYHAIALAALAANSFEGATVTMTEDSFLAEVEGYRLGVSEGRIWTNLGTPGYSRRLVNASHASGFANWGRQGVVFLRQPSETNVYTKLRAWSDLNEDRLGGQKAGFDLALNLLRNRSKGRTSAELESALILPVDRSAFAQAVRLASGFERFTRPYQEMRELLVPSFMTSSQFRERFGSSPPSNKVFHHRAEMWRSALTSLSNSTRIN